MRSTLSCQQSIVVQLLTHAGQPLTVHQLVARSGGLLTEQGLPKVLRRLQDKRRVVCTGVVVRKTGARSYALWSRELAASAPPGRRATSGKVDPELVKLRAAVFPRDRVALPVITLSRADLERLIELERVDARRRPRKVR
jgi:hypothetical protein